MRDHYDFSSMQGKKNPHALKQSEAAHLDTDSVEYFKNNFQNVMNEQEMPKKHRL